MKLIAVARNANPIIDPFDGIWIPAIENKPWFAVLLLVAAITRNTLHLAYLATLPITAV